MGWLHLLAPNDQPRWLCHPELPRERSPLVSDAGTSFPTLAVAGSKDILRPKNSFLLSATEHSNGPALESLHWGDTFRMNAPQNTSIKKWKSFYCGLKTLRNSSWADGPWGNGKKKENVKGKNGIPRGELSQGVNQGQDAQQTGLSFAGLYHFHSQWFVKDPCIGT